MNTQERSTETRAFMHSLRSRISVDGEGLLDEPREAGEIRAEVSTYNRLWTLARNLWWTSQPEVTRLFRELARIRWRQLAHNPIALLSEFTLERLDQRVNELVLRSQINHAYRRLVEYLDSEATWGALPGGVLRVWPVAYFSAEFGLHESLPIYSGGLGVLAGDHIKSASDLGVPLVGIGLYYSLGYFQQRLNKEGWQQEESLAVNPAQLPLEPVFGTNGEPLVIKIETRQGSIAARIWELRVGRCWLLLLDSDVEGTGWFSSRITTSTWGAIWFKE